MPLLGLVATACVSSPRDWAVSVGSHMQQDVEMSLAPPHPGAPFHALEAVTSIEKLAIVSPGTWLPSGAF